MGGKENREQMSHQNWSLQRLYKLFTQTFIPGFEVVFLKKENIMHICKPQRKKTQMNR